MPEKSGEKRNLGFYGLPELFMGLVSIAVDKQCLSY